MTKNNRLLLINPPFPRKVTAVPLQLLYLASAVRQAGGEVQILDLDIEEPSQRDSILEQKLRDYKPDFVGATAYAPNMPEHLEILKRVKEIVPQTTTISGGPYQVVMGGHTPKPKYVDKVVTDTFGERALVKIMGLEGKIEYRSQLFPAYDLLKGNPQYQFDDALFAKPDGTPRKNTQILTATGCSQGCGFCGAQQEYTPFENKLVVKQLEQLVNNGYDSVFFNDPNFTDVSKDNIVQIQGLKKTNPANGSEKYQRVLGLMNDLIEARKGNAKLQELVWGCQTKASQVTPEVLDKMAEAGCIYVTYALETVDRDTLRAIGKGITPGHVANAVRWSRERGMKVGLYVMFGGYQDRDQTVFDPQKDLENAESTIKYAEELKPDYLSTSIYATYPRFDRQSPRFNKSGNKLQVPILDKHIDYANQKFSREPIWLNFDEGWGAFHPTVNIEHAKKYLGIMEVRKKVNPEVWDNIRRF